MATVSKLVIECMTNNGDKTFSWNYANPEASVTDVKTLGQTLIANGDIFEEPPTAMKAARIVTTTSTDYDLSE